MYRCAVAMLGCPASAIITRTLTPFSVKLVKKPRRPLWLLAPK
jgi:hypothetical protein